MVEIRDLTYLVACVDEGSFSAAAQKLYTTQSSVSKVIKAMEEELGEELFVRMPKGIVPTTRGREVYETAMIILESARNLKPRSKPAREIHNLSISFNPSSWFSQAFVNFYDKHSEDALHYQAFSASTREVTGHIKKRVSDLGFVYVMKSSYPAFSFYLKQNYLEFDLLEETNLVLYTSDREAVEAQKMPAFDTLRLIQHFPDEYSPDNYWDISDDQGTSADAAETVISTNSDYIMQQILKRGSLSNISCSYLSGDSWTGLDNGIPFSKSSQDVCFGVIHRKGEEYTSYQTMFLEHIRQQLIH